jgi:multiple sugar transport system ATP-binding protein
MWVSPFEPSSVVADIQLDRVSVVIGGTAVLRDISMSIGSGELIGVVGPSGSGKSTLLRAIAGLVPIARGRLRFDGVDVTAAPSGTRDASMVFDQPVLLPKRSVRRNVSFPLELRHQDSDEIGRRVDAEARALRIEALLERTPSELSHGEAQLVQIARALVRVPNVLLLDEPFANLDVHVRQRLRADFRVLQDGYAVTTVMTTSDVDDAVAMPHRLAVLERGRVVQLASPAEVYRRPATLGAAMSTGPYSVIPVRVAADGDGLVLVGAEGADSTGHADRADTASFRHRITAPTLRDRLGETMLLGVRPTDAVLDGDGPITAVVLRTAAAPASTLICRVAGSEVTVAGRHERVPSGQRLNMRFDAVTVFDRSSEHAVVFV